jgi:D-psicose/D-tagatose/L-ribulose 3-epimerase
MILGIHIYLFTDRWSDDRLQVLDTAASLGAGAVEIAVGDDVHFTPRLTRRRAEQLGLRTYVGPGGLWPLECDLSSDDPAERAAGLAWHRRQVDLASEMGAVGYAGALYGHPGVVKRRVPPADEYERTAEGLHKLAEHGAQRGVAIVLEPMSHFRTHLVNTPEQMMHLIGLSGHPNLRVLFDTYHMVTEVRDYGRALRIVGELLWGLHACENDRGMPGGGLVPWKTVFTTLREIGFDGYVVLETYNSSIGDFAYQRGMYHNVCPDGVAFARESFRFLVAGLRTTGLNGHL